MIRYDDDDSKDSPLSLYFSRDLKLRIFFRKKESWSEEQEVLKMRSDLTQNEKNNTSKNKE